MFRWANILLSVCLACSGLASAAPNTPPKEFPPYPTKGWTPYPGGCEKSRERALWKLKAYTFPAELEKHEKLKGRRSTALIIIKNGYLFHEQYARWVRADTKQNLYEMTEGVVNALVGIAVRERRLRLDDSICKGSISQKCNIKIDHLLTHTSGISWREVDLAQGSHTGSDTMQMFYGKGAGNPAEYVLEQDQEEFPGQMWVFNPGDSTLLMAVLKEVYGAVYQDLPWKLLFYPLGIQDVTWEQDPQGLFYGARDLYMNASDLAKIGYLYLRGGKWEHFSLFVDSWVPYTSTPTKAFQWGRVKRMRRQVGGALWWLNKPIEQARFNKPYKNAPASTLILQGQGGQVLCVLPEYDTVVVRFGDTRDGSFDVDTFLDLVIKLVV